MPLVVLIARFQVGAVGIPNLIEGFARIIYHMLGRCAIRCEVVFGHFRVRA